jgi:cytidine deaminase
LARAAIAEIRKVRQTLTGSTDKPADSVAYVLRQFKHPREIELLRRVYGTSLVVIAGNAPEETRAKDLAHLLASTATDASTKEFLWEAHQLINNDQSEERWPDDLSGFRSNTRDTYPLADFFVDLSVGEGRSVERFVDLLFGHPFHTPSPEEMAMHQAHAMSLRSSDERRQVGAVIVKRSARGETPNPLADATVVASGMNEVPRRGGGYYQELDSPDNRDQAIRQSGDREELIKRDVLREIAERLKANDWLVDRLKDLGPPELAKELSAILSKTQFSGISEFMRQVHAEMAAIVDAAMRGVPVLGCEMYVTTSPCHGCAKHIIAAGISKVVYLEPYPKSRAAVLHKEEINLDPKNRLEAGERIVFISFIGVAPRQFPRLFSMAGRGRKNGLALDQWRERQRTLSPLHIGTNAAYAYMQSEREELEKLPIEYMWDRPTIAPAIVVPTPSGT